MLVSSSPCRAACLAPRSCCPDQHIAGGRYMGTGHPTMHSLVFAPPVLLPGEVRAPSLHSPASLQANTSTVQRRGSGKQNTAIEES